MKLADAATSVYGNTGWAQANAGIGGIGTWLPIIVQILQSLLGGGCTTPAMMQRRMARQGFLERRAIERTVAGYVDNPAQQVDLEAAVSVTAHGIATGPSGLSNITELMQEAQQSQG